MTRERRYILVILLALGLLSYFELTRPTPIDWRESYSGGEKIPYGCYAVRELLGEIFPEDSIVTVTTAAYNTLEREPAGAHNYIFINSDLRFDQLDVRRLLAFVEKGSNVFIAASAIDNGFLDTLGLDARSYYGDDTLRIELVNPALRSERPWAYPKISLRNHFTRFDSTRTVVLGKLGEGMPNFVRVRHGAGSFYLNMVPLAFTNYHLLDSATLDYPFRALSYLPPIATIWDEHYKDGRVEVRSPLRYLLSQDSLRWAYYLTLAGVLLFVLVHARRRQRIIPEMAPPRNATVDFVETVGMLYLNSGDHAGIARKQIAYLLEQMRSSYGVGTEERGEELYEMVAKRSGVRSEDVRELFETMAVVEKQERISEEELQRLNKAIERFNKEKER